MNRNLLFDTISLMTPGQLVVLQRQYAADRERYQYLLKVIEIVSARKSDPAASEEVLRLREAAVLDDRARFRQTLNRYIDRYRKIAKEQGKRGTQTELYEAAGFNHNSWTRMKAADGRGPQYGDRMRCLCVLFRLSFMEMNEFLMLAGQAIDISDSREYHICRCIQRQMYVPEEIDDYLLRQKKRPLFVEE